MTHSAVADLYRDSQRHRMFPVCFAEIWL